MRVLGIDCGTERTGWGVIESDGRRHSVLGHGVISLAVRDPFQKRLATIAEALRLVIEQHAPAAAAVEEIFYSQNVKTALKLAHVRGVVLAAIAEGAGGNIFIRFIGPEKTVTAGLAKYEQLLASLQPG